MDGYEVIGVVWSTLHARKATARYLYVRPTTQLLYQGAGTAGKTSPEGWFAITVECKVSDSIPEREGGAFHS